MVYNSIDVRLENHQLFPDLWMDATLKSITYIDNSNNSKTFEYFDNRGFNSDTNNLFKQLLDFIVSGMYTKQVSK